MIVGTYFKTLQNNLTMTYPRGYFKRRLILKNPSDWLEEIVDIVISFVYKTIKPFEVIPKEYIESGKKIWIEQIVLAGYRLADFIKYIDSYSVWIDYKFLNYNWDL